MAKSPAQTQQRFNDAINGWRSLRPTKKILGMTVDEFEAEFKASSKTREEVADLEAKLLGALSQRDEADASGEKLFARVVNAIKADTDEGEDSELLETFGYVRKSKRKSGLHRGSAKNTIVLPKAA